MATNNAGPLVTVPRAQLSNMVWRNTVLLTEGMLKRQICKEGLSLRAPSLPDLGRIGL